MAYRIFIFSDMNNGQGPISWAVDTEELVYEAGTEAKLNGLGDGEPDAKPDAALLDLPSLSDNRAHRLTSLCQQIGLPVIAVLSREHVKANAPPPNVDDFIVQPFPLAELLMRLNQVTLRSGGASSNKIVVGNLMIDLERYEVRLEEKRVLLTYKEYQLLVLLASNAGKVYTRDGLLSQVWGYDYFGGTRTVDVHIRRVRSKIEVSGHSFIETIWNVGYRFRTQARGLGEH